ncbi:MAG: radical SAM protein [Candidatus Omnitrophica bacterium]|nr:radical SAM protein [Candidatus Omnitrophota bacterium]
MIKKTVIIVGYECNNKCIFCIDSNKRALPAKSTADIVSEMVSARKRGTTYLEIIGGEETVRQDFLYLVSTAKRLKFKDIVIATNGRMLAYRSFAEQVVKAGITGIIFSIHGHNEKLHDSLTRSKGSFKQLMKGIRNISDLGLKDIGSNTTIVKQNYRSLPKIGKFIDSLGISNAEFIFVDPSCGEAKDNFNKIVPRLSAAAPYIRKCLDIGKKNQARHWHIRYVPLCLFAEHQDQVSELYESTVFNTEHLAPDFRNFEVEKSRRQTGRIKPAKCKTCLKFDACEGVWLEYYKRFGDKELKPVMIK